MPDGTRKQLVPARAPALEMSRNASGSFDLDAFHAMNERDNALVSDEILHGAGSSKFVYNFKVGATQVAGISVIGARHLFRHVGGLKYKMIASIEKRGELMIATSYPQEGRGIQFDAHEAPALREQPDFYKVVGEITDVKTGNSIQVERMELRWEARRDGSEYERPNFQTIAQSKCFRNAVIDIVDQAVQIAWKAEQLKLGRSEEITDSVLDQKRSAVLQFATRHAIPLLRDQVNGLAMDQIAGLSDAAREGQVPAFAQAASAMGLVNAPEPAEPEEEAAPAPQEAPQAEAPAEEPAPKPQGTRKKLFE